MPSASSKPEKPTPDFPLFPHAAGVWAKKILGKTHYFGPWADPKGALQKYLDQRDDLQAGRKPRVKGDGLTVRDLVNKYLTWKQHQLDSGEIAPRTFGDCHKASERIVSEFGKGRLVTDLASDDFEGFRRHLAESLGPLALGIEIQRIRSVFKYGHDSGLIDGQVRFGKAFQKPSRKVLRAERQRRGPRMLESAELRTILNALDGKPITLDGKDKPVELSPAPAMKAMALLALNCGMGNRDVALMPTSAVDLQRGWIDYPRPKTAVPRRAPLWPETVEAIRDALEHRPEPADDTDAHLLFITRLGRCFVEQSDGERKAWKDSVGLAFGKLLRALDMKRDGVNFYSLRHVFRTVADGARDQPAVDFIMGHAPDGSDMAARYRQRIEDERLQVVTDHVRAWLWP